ncbi:pyridoxal kinase PdxY [Micrococcales bacterium 31B]|nr:pyridoxal kinase PdxY [Micrococcales bacterium 31B]
MRVLSIQSHVAFGYVGNSAATFTLQRLGHDVIDVLTVNFSNHTGYGAWRGVPVAPEVLAEIVQGVDERGALDDVKLVLTGYQGSGAVADAILNGLAQVRRKNPAVQYVCDPVMGDVGRGLFVAPGVPELIRDTVLAHANVLTPNAFELAFLAGLLPEGSTDLPAEFATRAGILAAAEQVFAQMADGPRTMLITSVTHDEVPEGSLALLATDGTNVFEVQTPLLPVSVNGAGDVTSALFAAHLGDGLQVALERTASSVFGILDATVAAGTHEIQLVGAQDELVAPTRVFEARAI